MDDAEETRENCEIDNKLNKVISPVRLNNDRSFIEKNPYEKFGGKHNTKEQNEGGNEFDYLNSKISQINVIDENGDVSTDDGDQYDTNYKYLIVDSDNEDQTAMSLDLNDSIPFIDETPDESPIPEADRSDTSIITPVNDSSKSNSFIDYSILVSPIPNELSNLNGQELKDVSENIFEDTSILTSD